ncbi:MAG: CaiB/BaiF CoA transferase family protein [Syntrophales bacterium]|jgi:(R)-2-hydroxy-4-methylpentanoate CoA-transferase
MEQKYPPLKGIRVVDLTTFVAGPATTRTLADWGADVIKIEATAGDAWRKFGLALGIPASDDENPLFDMENTSKRFIAVDVRTMKGQTILHQLLADADVFVTNIREDALQKLNLTYDELSPKYPKLVYAHVTGLGDKGPDSKRPGFDIVAYWARSGALLDLCERGSSPLCPPYAFGDHPTGVTLAGGICAALVKQRQTGIGDKVSISLLGNAIFNAGMMIMTAQKKYGEIWPKSRKSPSLPSNNTYICNDGEWIILGMIEHERYWPIFCEKVIDRPELAHDKRFDTVKEVKKNCELLVSILDDTFITKGRSEWEVLLQKADIAYDKVAHFKDVSEDPQAWANDCFYEHSFRNGQKAVLPRTPVQFGSIKKLTIPPPVGRVGEHTISILKELGYKQSEIEIMEKERVIKV